MKSTMILPCGVSSAPKPAAAGVTLAVSLVTSPLRNLRASSPATLTTPRSGSSAAFMAYDRTDVAANVRRSLHGHKCPAASCAGSSAEKTRVNALMPRIHRLWKSSFSKDGWVAPQLGLARVARHYAPQVG